MSYDKTNNEYFVSKQQLPTQDGEIIFEGMTSISAIFHGISTGISDRRVLRVYFDRERLQKKEKDGML